MQRVAQDKNFFSYFCVVFYIFVAGNHGHFKFGVQIDHSKSQPVMTNCPWNGRGHVTWSTLNFKAVNISGIRITEARIVKFLAQVGYQKDISPLNGRGYGYVYVTVWKFAVCRDAECPSGLSEIAELIVMNMTVGCGDTCWLMRGRIYATANATECSDDIVFTTVGMRAYVLMLVTSVSQYLTIGNSTYHPS